MVLLLADSSQIPTFVLLLNVFPVIWLLSELLTIRPLGLAFAVFKLNVFESELDSITIPMFRLLMAVLPVRVLLVELVCKVIPLP